MQKGIANQQFHAGPEGHKGISAATIQNIIFIIELRVINLATTTLTSDSSGVNRY